MNKLDPKPVEISFFDTKVVTNKKGEQETIPSFIPECCRLGLSSCKHVLKKQRPIKRNVGM